MSQGNWALRVALLAGVALLSSSALAAPPNLGDLAGIAGADRLSDAAVKLIDDYIKAQADIIAAAKAPEEVAKAREALINGYKANEGEFYRIEYGRGLAKYVPALLDLNDPLKKVKEVAAAMAVAEVPQATSGPALAVLIVHKNPAVRYWAAKGYRSAMAKLVTQGPQVTAATLAIIQKAGLAETSGPVLTGLVRALSPWQGATATDIAQLQKVAAAIWLGRSGDVKAGNVEIVEAFRKSLPVLPLIFPTPSNPLQQLADAAEAASSAMLSTDNQEEPIARQLADLLIDLEAQLKQAAGSTMNPMTSALSKLGAGGWDQKATEARLAWNEKWKPLLEKEKGIKPQAIPAPTTAPAKTSTTSEDK